MRDKVENSPNPPNATEMGEALCVLGHEGTCSAKLRKSKLRNQVKWKGAGKTRKINKLKKKKI